MWISIAVVILFPYSFVIADVNISYTIKNYQNPYNLDSRLRKCEALNVFGDHCDPFFHFTAYTSTQKWERRSTLRKEVGPFVNSKYIDQILEAYEIQPTLPDLIEIELDIQDSDIDEDQRIALFRRQIPLEGKGKHEFRMGVDVKVEAHIEITCTKDYYGKRCEVYCIPLHDLWTCDENTGVRICNKPCLHGKCVLTSISAICQCTSDWQGEFCQTPIKSEIISTILAPDIKTIHVAKPIQIDQSVNRNSRISTSSVTTPSKKMSTTTQSDSKNSEQKEINTNAETHSEFSEELVKIVQLKFDNLQNLRKNHLDADLSVSTLPIPTITTTDKVIVSDQFKKNEEMIKESDSVIHPSGHFFNNETRNYMILALIIIGLLLWLIGVLVIGLVCYRRRRNRKVPVRKSALWSNISYDPNSYHVKYSPSTEPFVSPYDNENHQKNIHLISTDSSIYPSLLKKSSPKSVLRNSSTLPRLPINEHIQRRSIRYTRSPNEISRLRFGTISYTPVSSPSLSMCTQQSTLSPTDSCQPINDTYEELTCCLNNHSNWKCNNSNVNNNNNGNNNNNNNNLPTAPKLTTFH